LNWNIGTMEWWNNGENKNFKKKKRFTQLSNIPIFHRSGFIGVR